MKLRLPLVALAFALPTLPLAAQDFGAERRLAFPASNVTDAFAGDLDGDGDVDLVYAGHSQVGWFENRGPAGFGFGAVIEQLVVFDFVANAVSVNGADLDGDGDLDLVTASSLDDQLKWFENTGGGVFGAAQVIQSNTGVIYETALADLDGDGLLDVVATEALGQRVAWHRNLGAAGFGPAQTISTLQDFYYAVAAGDVDNDGDMDLVAGGADRVVVLLNGGSGVFATTVEVEGDPQSCRDIVLGDLDGDGLLDLAWPSTFGESIAWHRNLGGGVFGVAQVIAAGLPTSTNMAAGDLDGDGDVDLVGSSYNFGTAGELHVYLNDGSGSFAGSLVETQIAVVEGVGLADLDGSGTLDLFMGVRDLGRVSYFPNLGAGSFGSEVVASSGLEQAGQVHAVDIDGDGDQDVLCQAGPDLLVWYENLGLEQFSGQQVFFVAPGVVRDFDLFDAENDGDLDLVVTGAFGLELYPNLGGGVLGPVSVIQGPTSNGWRIEAGDLDLDGRADLAYAFGKATGYSGASKLSILQNLGGAQFGPPVTVAGSIGVSSIQIEDVVGSAHPEVLYVQGYYDTVTWIKVFGGDFGQLGTAPGAQLGTSSVEVADIDGDGLRDILTSSYYGLAYNPNLGNDTFGNRIYLSDQGHNDARFVDLDGDGLGDILAAENAEYQKQGGLTWRRNLGGGSYAPEVTLEGNWLSPYRALTADLNGDGALDVIGTSYDEQNLSWYPNRMTADCNQNGTLDALEIAQGLVADCNGNGVPDGCDLVLPGMDTDGDGQLDDCVAPALKASQTELSLSAGGAQQLVLNAPAAGATYLVVGSIHGTSPGTLFSGLLVPLNVDAYTQVTVQFPNVAPYTNSLGTLQPGGSGGTAIAVITVPAGFNPALAGVTLHHAFVVLQPGGGISFASNAVVLQLVF